jgi:hypothetical protein
VSENFFLVLGVAPLAGRGFESIGPEELSAAPAALISEDYWQRRFGGDAAVLGKSIRLNGVAFTIVGITPHGFVGTSIAAPNFWLPISVSRSCIQEARGSATARIRVAECSVAWRPRQPGTSAGRDNAARVAAAGTARAGVRAPQGHPAR